MPYMDLKISTLCYYLVLDPQRDSQLREIEFKDHKIVELGEFGLPAQRPRYVSVIYEFSVDDVKLNYQLEAAQ